MLDKLKGIEERFLLLEKQLADPDVFKDPENFKNISREHAELSKIVDVYREYQQALTDLEDNEELVKDSDPDIRGPCKG